MKKIIVVVVCAVMFFTACSTAWVATLDSILAAAAPALINILQIVAMANGGLANTNLAAKITADATVIETLAKDFAQSTSGSAPDICQELQAAVSTYEGDQQLVLQVAQVSDANTQTKITLLVDLVASTVSAITAVIPSCGNTASFQSLKASKAYSVSNFAARYNRILVTPTGNEAVDSITQKLKLHQHSKVARSLTFGLLQ